MYSDFYKTHLEKSFQKNGEVSGKCPFHEDTNPSFSANVETGQACCFGCDWKGNAISFAKAMKIPFSEVPGYQGNNRIVRRW